MIAKQSVSPQVRQRYRRHRILIRQAAIPSLRRDLDRFFRWQAQAVADRYRGKPVKAIATAVPLHVLIPDQDADLLIRVMLPHSRRMVINASSLAAEVFGMAAINPANPLLNLLAEQSAQRVVGITDATRTAVQGHLRRATARGDTDAQIAVRLRRLVTQTYSGRAETIARTELALASNEGAGLQLLAAGETTVEIIDGPECGWDGHDDGDLATGTIRTIEAFRAQPVSHPNCVRDGMPIAR